MTTLAVPPIVIGILSLLFILIAGFMMLVILIQKPKGGGLSGAFGGGGGSEGAAFGAKAGDMLTIVTTASFVGFILLAVILTRIINDSHAEAVAGTPQPPTEEQRVDEAVNEALTEDALPTPDGETIVIPEAGTDVTDLNLPPVPEVNTPEAPVTPAETAPFTTEPAPAPQEQTP
ncbi:preprotein translocase subunit SecG [Poriferisphaera sp. WC338]|uniref:preprotein translocase subunit SecG n=1 Tax=Poriferisphaera sp. WC338 TaxID=3425129 RepID=UPI003D812D2B